MFRVTVLCGEIMVAGFMRLQRHPQSQSYPYNGVQRSLGYMNMGITEKTMETTIVLIMERNTETSN